MAAIEKVVNICKLGKKSKRGYFFNEKAVRDFIDGPVWAKRKNDRTAFGMVTHRNRRAPDKEADKELISTADWQLRDQHVVSTITDMFIEDGYWRARMLIFDPDDFVGSPAYEDIKFVYGLVKNGVKLRSSAGIAAYYNPVTKEGEKIHDFAGIDFTQNPDFVEGGIV